jgi:hypothetical protein
MNSGEIRMAFFLWNCISRFGDVPVFSQLLLWIVSGVSPFVFIFPASVVVVCVSLQATQQYIAGS